MISDNHDPLAAALAELAVDPPSRLLDRVIARWVRVPGPAGLLYVASTELARRGVRYLASGTTGMVCFPSCSDARRITPAHRQGFASVAAAQLATGRASTADPSPQSQSQSRRRHDRLDH